MNRRKKNWLLVLIYTIMILLCFGIVMVVDNLNTSHPAMEETPGKPYEESTGGPEQEEGTDEKNHIYPETEINNEKAETESPKNIGMKQPDKPPVKEETQEETKEYKPPMIVVASDVHYYSPELTDYGEAFEKMQKRDDGKLANYIPQLFDAFTAEMESLKPSCVILSGDLTLNGEKAGHEALAKKLLTLEEKGVKVLVIPGNHDINNYASASYFGKERKPADIVAAGEFYDIYHPFGYDQARSRDENSLSYVYELDEKNWLLMLDSAQYEPINKVGGRIKGETLVWMKKQLEEAKTQEITVITVGHHNLLKESILYPTDCTLENSQEVIGLLESYQVPLYISGHLHLQRTKKHKSQPGEREGAYHISEVVADSFAISPFQYGLLKWTADGRLVYTTRETDVEHWAEETGSLDENLLHFKEYGMNFLTEVVSGQISNKIANLPEEQVQKMAGLYGEINRAYCEGVPVDAKEIKSEEAFRLWQRNLSDSRMFAEIGKILKDTGDDHNTWECELKKKE